MRACAISHVTSSLARATADMCEARRVNFFHAVIRNVRAIIGLEAREGEKKKEGDEGQEGTNKVGGRGRKGVSLKIGR